MHDSLAYLCPGSSPHPTCANGDRWQEGLLDLAIEKSTPSSFVLFPADLSPFLDVNHVGPVIENALQIYKILASIFLPALRIYLQQMQEAYPAIRREQSLEIGQLVEHVPGDLGKNQYIRFEFSKRLQEQDIPRKECGTRIELPRFRNCSF